MNRTKVLRALALLPLLIAAGCAMAPLPPNPADQDPRAGTIVFYRPMYSLFGHGQRPELLVDGLRVGKSVPGEWFAAKAAPGPHVVSAPSTMYSGVATLDVVVRSGEKIYVRTSMGGPAWAGLATVELVDQVTAAPEVDKIIAAKR